MRRILSHLRSASVPAIGLLVLLGLPRFLRGYDNDNLPRTIAEGPHRTINHWALEHFIEGAKKDPVFGNYDFKKEFGLTGVGVTQGGMTHLNWTQGDRKGTWRWWVQEGGYTADEPELYASFRHFYDPRSLNGVTYLTDHLQDLERYWGYASPAASQVIRVNPEIDARDWAISGPRSGGLFANEYAWDRGVEYLQQAFISAKSDKDRLFAKAWRALGETMHLMGDMTCVPHVRNDSHPAKSLTGGDPNQGLLRSDPYETLCRESLITACAGNGLDPEAKRRIDTAKDPMILFYGIAGYTQDRFFSSDTVSGTDRLGRAVTSANGNPDYPNPKLAPANYDPKTGAYRSSVAGQNVSLAHETWLGSNGWGEASQAVAVSSACVQEQASVLIPVAVAANKKLIEWFVPKIEVQLTGWEAASKTLRGQIVHRTGGAHTKPLIFNAGPSQSFNLHLDGSLQDWAKVKLDVRNNQITVNLGALSPRDGQKARLELEMGGISIRSNDLPLGVPTKKQEAQVFTRYCDISFHCLASYSQSFWRWGGSKEWHFGTKDFTYSRNGIPIGAGGSFSGTLKDDRSEQTVTGRISGNMLSELVWTAKKKDRGDKFEYEEKLEITFKDLPWNETNGGYWIEFIDLDTLSPIPNGLRHIPKLKHEIKTSDGKKIELTGFDITRHGLPRKSGGGLDLMRLSPFHYRPMVTVKVYELDQHWNPRR